MKEFIERKVKTEKIMRYCMFALLPITILCFVLTVALSNIVLGLWWALTFIIFWVIFSIYVTKLVPFLKSVEMLKKRGMLTSVYDIDLNRPISPNTKVYCGEKAFFCKKSYVIMPYSEIAWAYQYKQMTYGVTVSKSIILYNRDGKQFTLYIDVDKFKWLLSELIIKNSPDIIIGYGPEQKARYKQINPKFGEGAKKAKRIFGIVLWTYCFFFIMNVIVNPKNVEVVPVIILALISGISGTFFYLSGRKK